MPTLPNLEKIGILLAALLASLALVSFTLPHGGALRTPAAPQSAAISQGLLKLVRRSELAPPLDAEAALIERLRTGEALWERNADRELAMASLTKLMTALVLAETGHALDDVFFSLWAHAAGDPDEKRSAVAAGERLRVEDVLKLLIVSSDSDAAYAAAEFVANRIQAGADELSSEERMAIFMRHLNGRAEAIGLTRTGFANPSGRDQEGNYSTGRDIVTLMRHIEAHHPELWTISRISETFIFSVSGTRYGVVNTNPLLLEYPAIYGSKTGFEDEAKGTLAMLYRLSPDELIAIVLLKSRDRFADGRAAIQWLESSFTLE